MNSPYKMKGKSPMMKALIGKQNRLPAELKAKILASPAKMMKKSPAKGVKVKPREGSDYTKSNSDLNKRTGMGPRVKKSALKPFSKMTPAEKKKMSKPLGHEVLHGKSPAKMYGKKSPAKAKKTASDQEVMTNKKSTDAVVNSKTKRISSVGTERLIAAGAPKDVIAKSKAKFIKEQKKKSPAKNKVVDTLKKVYKATVPPVVQKVNKKIVSAVTSGKGKAKTKAKKMMLTKEFKKLSPKGEYTTKKNPVSRPDNKYEREGDKQFNKKSPAKNYKKGYYGA